MAQMNLDGLKVAILVDDGFELVEPRNARDGAEAETRIVSPKGERVRGGNFTDWGDEFPVDLALDRAQPGDFDALLLPGGVPNPDTLRTQPKAVEFVKSFFDAGKPVAAICHGPWTVIEADAANGRRIASWPSLKTDLSAVAAPRRGLDLGMTHIDTAEMYESGAAEDVVAEAIAGHDTAETWLEHRVRSQVSRQSRPARTVPPARPVNAEDRSTYDGGGAKGYRDYTTFAQERGKEPEPCVDDRWR